MTNARVTVGILGCANVARRYAIPALQALPEVSDIIVASRDRDKSKAFADEFNVQTRPSYAALIDDSDIDALYVPLPVGLHEEWVIRAAVARKHVICEKSLSHSLVSAAKIIDACRKNGVVLFENFMCDYHPQHAAVLSLIRQKAIGDPLTFTGYFGFPALAKDDIRYKKDLGGGSLNDAGAYTVFMARKLLEAEPVSVTCYLDRGVSAEVDTRGSACLEFPDHKIAFVAFGFDNFYQNNYSIWGSSGKVSVDRAYSIPPEMKPSVTMYTQGASPDAKQDIPVPATNHFELIFRDFCQAILGADDDRRNDRYGQLMNQARALEAMRRSAARGHTVRMDEMSQ